MVEEIEEFLLGVLSPELTHVYVDAAQVVLDSGISMHIVQLDGLISQEDKLGRDQVVNELVAYLRNVTESTLNQFGVFVKEDFDLKVITALIRSINTFDNFDDVETIEALCISEESPEERLAALAELTSEYSLEEFLLNLERVSTALLQRILQSVHKVDDSLEEDNPERTGKILRIKSCISQIENPWLLEYVERGGGINQSLEAMTTVFREFYEEKLESNVLLERDFDHVGLQMMSFILASNTPDEELLKASEQVVEEVFDKMPVILRYLEVVRALLAAVTDEKD